MAIATGFNDHFDRLGRAIRQRATQAWVVGQTVNVGFLKGLTITEDCNGFYRLQAQNGNRYEFEPHFGIRRV